MENPETQTHASENPNPAVQQTTEPTPVATPEHKEVSPTQGTENSQPQSETKELGSQEEKATNQETQSQENVSKDPQPEAQVQQPAQQVRKPKVSSGAAEAQGDRNTMEDTHVHIDNLHEDFKGHSHLIPEQSYAFYGVYDGHGGRQTAELAQVIVHRHLVNSEAFKKQEYENAIKHAFAVSDQEILDKAASEQWTTNGCTVASCLVVNNDLYLANLGDAELIVGKVGDQSNIVGEQLTEKHKASGDKEKERIKKLGGVVIYGRIFGTLAVSRSFGDAEFKIPKTGANFVSSEPFFKKITLVPDVHLFLIIACDGLWDVVNYQEAVDIVSKEFKEKKDPKQISQALVDEALKKGTQDNVTVVVVLFNWE
eukprot:TRINITY_DN4106_c0_g1_i1.p1 TRINITY_DN4106_c0_g1~~TRINITY_DN4106_c0_g1_i1.p1  ORF type:complete len:369 (-),score=115.93 TRINITY_DN4106_c0_g1_i1:89-1195(-)